MPAVQQHQIHGKAARFIYDRIVDRDLIIIADDINSLPAEAPQSEKRQVANTEDAVHKMSQLLGRGEAWHVAIVRIKGSLQVLSAELWGLTF